MPFTAIGVEFKDINGDGKINNQDLYEYKMADNDSKLEEDLRSTHLAYIHSGNKDKLIEATDNMIQKYNLMFINYTISNNAVSLTIKKSNKDNKIYYIINPQNNKTLIDNIYTKKIRLTKDDYIAYKECYKNNCSSVQIISFDGKKLYRFFIKTTDSSIFTDISYMNTLRAKIVEKSKELKNIRASIDFKNKEISDLDKSINSLNSDIEDVRNNLRGEIL